VTSGRVTNLYDLMDSAYDAPEIKQKVIAHPHGTIDSTRVVGDPIDFSCVKTQGMSQPLDDSAG
jgi:hypothetical protein